MDKKYELMETDYDGFYRIKALKDFQLITGDIVKKGDLGGLVDGEHNLSQEGNCWIEFEARAFDNSIVSGNAVMKGDSWAYNNSIITGNALLQARQHIQYSTVTTDLLGTKDWIGVLYAELGVVPQNNKVILYKRVWSTDDPDVFKSDYRQNFLYKIGKISRARNVDEDIFESCARGLHFTSLEFVKNYGGDTIIECEVKIDDIVTVLNSKVRARKCKVLRIYKEE